MSEIAPGGGKPGGKPPVGGTESATGSPCRIVAIGASAGGQDALEQLFTGMPSGCDLAFVVILHLPSTGPSFLAEMLGRYTPMKVLTAEEGMAPQSDTIHVIPAGRELTLRDGLFRLAAPAAKPGTLRPVDRCFRSLAAEAGESSIAVVLSGSGNDGAEGVKAVREAGGIVIVQEPGSAIAPAMPRSAIATGVADLILPAEELAEKIAGIARGTCHLPSRACRTTTLDEELAAVFAAVKARTGHDFSSYKRNTVIRRIERRMAVNDVAGMKKYIALLETNEQEAQALGQEILIGVTSFFRDPDAFKALHRKILPRLFANRDPDNPVRIWHACCATGEEVYSTAILIREYLKEQGLKAKVQLFATDIDEVAIAQARAGLYDDGIEAEMGEERLKTFFTRVDGRWQVAKQLREMVVFAHHSLIKDPPFSRVDLLVCRNFLIYINPDMQKRLISLFHLALKPGGFLFLGASETVERNSALFVSKDKKWKIFERLEGSRREDMFFPFTAPVRRFSKSVLPLRPSSAVQPNPGQIAEQLLMARYSPPCVVVNEKYEVVHVSTRANRYLEVPVGEPTRDLLKMAREELRPALRAAIYRAFTEQKQVVFRGVKMAFNGEEAAVNVLVEPLNAPPPVENLAMVILEPAPTPAMHPAPAGGEALTGDETAKEILIRQLEEQLRITHEQLQAVTEQLETSQEGFMSANEELMSINEEFQSANEELQSTNEELQTSEEELQALNEELATVNSELQGKVEELDRVNSDLENLLASSEIATIFFDRQLIIWRFSPAMASIFNLVPADIGRPFRHLAGTIDWTGLPEDARTVLASLVPIEREVAELEGERHYLMRVLPYRTSEGRIDGVVVTFVDITGRKQAEEALRKSEERLKRAQEIAHLGSWELDPVKNILTWSDEVYRIFGLQPQEFGASYEAFLEAVHPDDRAAVDAAYSGSLREGRDIYEIEHRVVRKSTGEIRYVHEKCEHFRDDAGRVIRSVGMVHDITARKQAEQALCESEERVRRKLERVLSPEGDLGVLELADLIDAPALQELMEDFYPVTRIPMSILDVKGRVLVGVGWQDICTRFHRVHPLTARHCLESDTQLSAGLAQGECRLYKCRNNLWDMATPIFVAGRHLGNIFTGQFFFEDETIDFEFFRAQARNYGFDEEEYLAALDRVPRLSRETINRGMAFFLKLADTLSQLGHSNVKLARLLSERDRLTDSLRESELFYRQTLESIPGMVFTTRPDGYCDYQSQQWVDFTGVPMSEHLGDGWNKLLHPDDRPRAFAAWRDAVEGRASYDLEYRVRRHDGEYEWFKVRGRPIHNEAGEVVRWFGTVLNIDHLVEIQEALLQAKAAAEAATRAKSEFLANMSHEIRTPMTVFMSALEHLLQIDRIPEHHHLLDMADKSAKRLRALIDDILDFSRIEARRVELEEEPFDLRTCVREAVEMFTLAAREKNLRMEVEMAADLPDIVAGDSGRLGQVLINLIGNAVKFTQEGEIRVSVKPHNSFLEFVVADTGIGIPEENRHQVFQSFSQADSSFNRQHGGSGLGLAISSGLVELMGGRIDVQSRKGKGSVFTFTLPLKTFERTGSAPSETLLEESVERNLAARILLADDEPMIREMISMMLAQGGWQTETAESGRSAIAKWEEGDFDIVIMDLQMPGMNGLEATRMIREREAERGKRTCIIGLTAHALLETRDECLAAGMDHVLIKPVQMNNLYSAIDSVYRNKNGPASG